MYVILSGPMAMYDNRISSSYVYAFENNSPDREESRMDAHSIRHTACIP
jgi:hypothetical protein